MCFKSNSVEDFIRNLNFIKVMNFIEEMTGIKVIIFVRVIYFTIVRNSVEVTFCWILAKFDKTRIFTINIRFTNLMNYQVSSNFIKWNEVITRKIIFIKHFNQSIFIKVRNLIRCLTLILVMIFIKVIDFIKMRDLIRRKKFIKKMNSMMVINFIMLMNFINVVDSIHLCNKFDRYHELR